MILCACRSAAHTTVLLHTRMSRFAHLMFYFKFLCVNSNSLKSLLFVMNNGNSSTYIATVHQYFQCFDISRVLGDRVEPQVNNWERPGIGNACLFLLHDQIMTFDWMWTVTWLFKTETVCGVWDHKRCHLIRWGDLYSLYTF